MTPTKEERLHAIKSFCRFIDNYKGEMVIRNGLIYNDKNELIYEFKL